MATCSVQDLVTISACYGNFPSIMLQRLQVSLLCQILQQSNPMADCSIQALIDSSQCYGTLSEYQLIRIQTQLLCEILHAGGGGGQSCLTCSINTDPVDVPICDCALHYRKDNSTLWYWDAEAVQWFLHG